MLYQVWQPIIVVDMEMSDLFFTLLGDDKL